MHVYSIYFPWLVAVKIAETKMHTIMGKDLTVELKKPTAIQKTSVTEEHEQAAILVSNVTDSISDDLLYLYFDNITELDGESGDYSIRRCDDSLQVIISFNASATLPTGGMYTGSNKSIVLCKICCFIMCYVNGYI